MSKESFQRKCKRCGVRMLMSSPALPTWFWDSFLPWKYGTTGPEVPSVLFVQDSTSGTSGVQLPLRNTPPCKVGFLRVVVISDTHERHRCVQVPEADVFLHCGDILISSSLQHQERGSRVLQDFNDWLETLPCKEKVIIGGNHDKALEQLGSGAKEVLSNAILLQDSSIRLPLAGIKVYGNSWSAGESHNRSWQTPEPPISDAVEGSDVVMSHACTKEIEEAVLRKAQPRLWASGHYHDKHGVAERNGIIFANAAILDGRCNPVQAPVVVDLPRRTTV